MNFQFTALILRQSADGIAGLAASRLFERFGDELTDDFTVWKAHFRSQVLHLAVALETQNGSGFANHVTWVRLAFHARGIPDPVILESVECLAEIARESVPAEFAPELDRYLESALQCFRTPPPSAPNLLAGNGPTQVLARAFLATLREGEEQKAADLVLDAHREQGLPIEVLLDGVLAPVLHEVGRLWHLGLATIAEEHFITQAARSTLTQLLAEAPQAPRNGKTAVLSSVADEVHSMGIQVVAAHLQLAGWRALSLGANTPVDELVQAARTYAADLVLLGVTVDLQIPNLIESIQQLRRDLPQTKILVGGSAFLRNPDLGLRVGADGEARDGRDAVHKANQLVP
ncbi:MAG: cobalamin-dependent protein [Planctomycetes bacterium]|nr:cobalamin-dependent protein [Planctomycetota bacterium]